MTILASRPARAGLGPLAVHGLKAARWWCLLVALAAASWVAEGAAAGGNVVFPTDRIVVVTADGARHDFEVELATTPQQRQQGLMFRESLAEDAGMLFLFDREAPHSFWMKDTIVSLDILFLDKTGRVVAIAARAEPLSTEQIPSGVPAAGVLEVVAGTSERLGIDLDARVEHRAFEAAP
jgi:uncharacterized membrane protein (UPF0127 family)